MARLIVIGLVLGLFSIVWADEPVLHPHAAPGKEECGPTNAADAVFDSVQIETADLKSYEVLFGDILKAPLIERQDHPEKDSVRGYCFRGVRLVVRRDYAVPRPTGWVQINFVVPDAGAIQREIETALKNSSVSETERDKIIRLRFKADVRRGDRKADRLEVTGPEGFMIGFNQYK